MRFAPTELTADELQLQADFRAFLAAELLPVGYQRALGMGAGKNKDFSKKVTAQGWPGMALLKKYGGHDRTAVDRFVVVEELLRHGAPVGYHWVAGRQPGSIINRFGTEDQRERFLPSICRGELGFSIGMSEPDSGSDLAGNVALMDRRARSGVWVGVSVRSLLASSSNAAARRRWSWRASTPSS